MHLQCLLYYLWLVRSAVLKGWMQALRDYFRRLYRPHRPKSISRGVLLWRLQLVQVWEIWNGKLPLESKRQRHVGNAAQQKHNVITISFRCRRDVITNFTGMNFIFVDFIGDSFTNWTKPIGLCVNFVFHRRLHISELYLVCECFAGIYTSIKSSKMKFIFIIPIRSYLRWKHELNNVFRNLRKGNSPKIPAYFIYWSIKSFPFFFFFLNLTSTNQITLNYLSWNYTSE